MNVLIFMKESDLRPAGGPAGFCYNIYQAVLRQKNDSIFFLPPESNREIEKRGIYHNIVKHLPRWINAMQIAYRRKHDYQQMMHTPSKHNINFKQYDAVHFHSTISLYKCRLDLQDYMGKVILTTHSPVPQFQEIYAELPTEAEKKWYGEFYKHLNEIDEYAFRRADYVIFPCTDAEESYITHWEQYISIHNQLEREGRLKYIPTGIEPKPVLRSREQVRGEHILSNEQFVVSYVGRHNQVKGYDLLQKIAENIWQRGDDYVFLICGKESPLRGLSDPKWIEIGWTNDSQSCIAASDVFVLPNRETYFDIIMLEVLSCGKIVVASRTGGNKYFDKIGAKGVFLYDSVEEAADLIEKIASMGTEEKHALEEINRELFRNCFTTDKYVSKYMEFLKTVK